jgi:hypothetical protein
MRTHDFSDLEVPFTEDEVWGVIRSKELDKAPGPDGFTSWFYAACWPIIKVDVMEAFETLWREVTLGDSTWQTKR